MAQVGMPAAGVSRLASATSASMKRSAAGFWTERASQTMLLTLNTDSAVLVRLFANQFCTPGRPLTLKDTAARTVVPS